MASDSYRFEVHRKGDLFREWSKHSRAYFTEGMSREALVEFMFDTWSMYRLDGTKYDTTAEMMRDVDALVSAARDVTEWETEGLLPCATCGATHHEYLPDVDGCLHCGAPEDESAHSEPCAEVSA